MDFIAPLAGMLIQIRFFLEEGKSVRSSVEFYIDQSTGPLRNRMVSWLNHYDNKSDQFVHVSSYEALVFSCLARGLDGYPVMEIIKDMEQDFIEICEHDLKTHIDQLSFKLMLPLLCFVFPAFLLLLIGKRLIDHFLPYLLSNNPALTTLG